jgi:hypothetical protein
MGRRRAVVVSEERGGTAAARDGAGEALAAFDAGERGEWWWRQPKWSKRAWKLEAGGRVVAELEGESLFSSTSRVRFDGLSFEVHRGWTGNAELRGGAEGDRLARFVSRWTGGGRVEPPAGDRLELVPTGFWQRSHELRTEDALVLARLESHDGLTRHEVRIELEDGARRRDDLRALIALASAIVFAPKRHSH